MRRAAMERIASMLYIATCVEIMFILCVYFLKEEDHPMRDLKFQLLRRLKLHHWCHHQLQVVVRRRTKVKAAHSLRKKSLMHCVQKVI